MTEDVINFCKDHGTPLMRVADDKERRNFLQQHEVRGHVFVARLNGIIDGVAIAWPVREDNASLEGDASSETVFVAQMSATTERGLKELVINGLDRWPEARRWIALRGEEAVLYEGRDVVRLLRYSALCNRKRLGLGE